MKLKALLAAVFVAGLVVSMAVAAPAEHGKGKNGSTAADTSSSGGTTTAGDTGHENTGKGKKKGHARWGNCHPRRAAVLVGDFAGAGTDSFAMSVEGGNRVGKKLYGKQVTVTVTDSTTFRRSGKATLADLETGDLVLVQGKACTS